MKNPAPPLVAELHGSEGLEVLAVFPEDGTVQCFDARGESLWIHSEASPAARVAPAFLGELLVFASAAGEIVALIPTTGEERWRSLSVGEEVLGIALADIDDDDATEVVVTTRAQGVVALDAEGQELWRFQSTLSGAPAIMDVNDDGYKEVFVITETGPVCIEFDGRPLWEADEQGKFVGTPVVGDTDADMLYEVYAIEADSPALVGFDADLGDMVFERNLELVRLNSTDSGKKLDWNPIAAYASGHLVVGDIDRDGSAEVVVSLPNKQTQIIRRDGGRHSWDNRRGAVTLANINRDSRVEYVIGAGHELLSGNGLEVGGWDTQLAAPIAAAPVVCNMDGIGPASIVVAHANGRICRWQTEGPHMPSLSPWPMDGANPARTHSTISPELYEPAKGELEPIAEVVDVWGWNPDSDERDLQTSSSQGNEVELADSQELERIQMAPWGTQLSPALALSPELRGLDITIAADMEFDGNVYLHWLSDGWSISKLELNPVTSGSRILYRVLNTPAAFVADGFVLMADTGASGELPEWQDVSIRGRFERIPTVQIFYNHVGYELGAEKRFTAVASFRAQEAELSVINAQDKAIFTRSFEGTGEQISGAYGNLWEGFYWSGDFTDFDQPGIYRLRVTIENAVAESAPFRIDRHLLWGALVPVLLNPYQNTRCGEADVDCGDASGWFDPALESAADPVPHVLALAEALKIAGWRLERDNPETYQAMQEEVAWGADALLGDVDDAIASGTPEANRAMAAALALAGAALPEGDVYLDAAGMLVQHEYARGTSGLMIWSAAVDLFVATKEDVWKDIATALYTGPSLEAPEASVAYETYIDEESLASFHVAYQMQEAVRPYLSQAQNPFGVYIIGSGQSDNWFGTPEAGVESELVGNTLAILAPATTLAQAYRFQPVPPYQRFILGQINWLLGNNPLSSELVTLPKTKKQAGKPGMGVVKNGISGRAPGDDRPALDDQPASLLNNARLIKVLANYKRVRLSM